MSRALSAAPGGKHPAPSLRLQTGCTQQAVFFAGWGRQRRVEVGPVYLGTRTVSITWTTDCRGGGGGAGAGRCG